MKVRLSLIILTLLSSFCCPGDDDCPACSVRDIRAKIALNDNIIHEFVITGQILQACSPLRKSFILTDGTDIIWLADNALWPECRFHAGDIVAASGRFGRQLQGIHPNCHRLERIGHAELPTPLDMTIRELTTEPYQDFRYVRVHGRINDVIRDDIDTGFLWVVLTDRGDSLYLSLKGLEADFRELKAAIGAEVSVNGVIHNDIRYTNSLGTSHTRQPNRRILEPTLNISGVEALRIIRPAPADPFDVQPLEALKPLWPKDLAAAPRHQAKGTVLSAAISRGFLLQTDKGQLVNVTLAEGSPPQKGDRVIVTGLPITDLFRINLTRAIWKSAEPTDSCAPDTAKTLSLKKLLTDMTGHTQYNIVLHGSRIRLRGTVKTMPSVTEDIQSITIEEDALDLSIVAEPGSDPFNGLELGSEIEVSGLCLMETESWRPGLVFPQVLGARVAVGSAQDILVISRPPWWTPARILTIAAILALFATAVLVWNLSLRVLVIRRSRQLFREQTVRLAETLRVEERTRIATELHDTIAQNLSGLSLQLDAATRLADSDPSAMKYLLGFVSKALLACRRELRDCLWDLRSQALDEKNMNAAIQKALAPHLANVKLTTRFTVPRSRISDPTAHTVLRIIGELTLNAIRHGKATSIQIAGSMDHEGLKFSCTDNGIGFDPDTAPGAGNGHFGLQGIRDRIHAYHGVLKIRSTPGKGTRAAVLLRHKSET